MRKLMLAIGLRLVEEDAMRPLAQSVAADFAGVEFVLTDMDDTLTHRGRLSAATYAALEQLQMGGVKVIPITAAPAGWCDQMVRMWPVDAVIGENGGVSMLRGGHGVQRAYWHGEDALVAISARLDGLRSKVAACLPGVRVAADQPFRLTSLAFERPSSSEAAAELCTFLRTNGAAATVNSLWVLAWIGGYDKLSAARRFLADAFALDVDAERQRIVYVGDSANDAPMFAHFPRSVGVSVPSRDQPPANVDHRRPRRSGLRRGGGRRADGAPIAVRLRGPS
jgi:predicted mannosyl-3-phosphoglycerate phosphatase (HAD superfamily)